MKISILTQLNSWFTKYTDFLAQELRKRGHEVKCIDRIDDIDRGDILFALSLYTIMPKPYLNLNKHNIVIHESDLPQGKGWAPLPWQVLEGKNDIVFTMFEVDEKVDNGPYYFKDVLRLEGHELNPELRDLQARKRIKMCLEFVNNYDELKTPKPQSGPESFYKRRTSESSELDLNKTINEQFNLFRIVDNESYPAFFIKNGKKYKLKIEKA
jgi:methionyl-tRNA formyltransferase